MEKRIQVSVIVPVYKVERYLNQCVDSILAQTYRDMEVILVDDGSPDKCGQICDEYAGRDSRVRVIHKENGGLVSAWLAGLDCAGSEYAAFVDSDDYIAPSCIADLVQGAADHDADIVIGTMVKFYKNDYKAYPNRRKGVYDRERLERELFPEILFDGRFHGRAYPVSRCGKLFKKDILKDNIRYCDTECSYSEDLNITFPAMLDAEKVVFLEADKGQYFYRMNPASMLHAYDRRMLKSILHVYPTLIQACRDKGKPELIPQVEADSLAASVQYYKNELLNPEGLRAVQKNIEAYTHNELLRQAVSQVDWTGFRKLNVIIIRSLKNYNWFQKYAVTPVLRVLKRSGLRKPS